jgi:hypothetical protein
MMESTPNHREGQNAAAAPHFTDEAATEPVPAWEEIATGRFMPRRIRGSNKGRALG